jgi:hypothetical protein
MKNYYNYLLKLQTKPYVKRADNEMRRSWLVQTFSATKTIIDKRYAGNIRVDSDDNSLYETNFGGGESGLSVDYMQELNKVVTFDSMGAAEYEFGKLAASVLRIESNLSELIIDEISIDNYSLFVLAKKKDMEDAKDCLMDLVLNSQFERYRQTKSAIYIDRMLVNNTEDKSGGWDIDNDYIFSVDYKTLKDLHVKFIENKNNNVKVLNK